MSSRSRRDCLLALAASVPAALSCRSRHLGLVDFAPKSMLRVPETDVPLARFPAIDFHSHLSWSAVGLGPEPYGELLTLA